MKRITYIVISVAAVVTLLLGAMASSRLASAAGLGFLVWGLSPYVYLAAMNRWMNSPLASKIVLITATLAGLLGAWMLIDAMYLNPDAQSGLVFLFAPLWQWFLLLVVTVPLHLYDRAATAAGA